MDTGRFRRGVFLGRGAYGEVYEGTDTITGERVAIKTVDCRRFKSILELEAAQAEVAMLSNLRHKHIVRLHSAHIAPTAIHFVMEYAGGGTLAEVLKAQDGRRLEEGEALRLFLQIFQAVEYCHRRCLVHRDLKPENILLDSQGDVKVADFGLASITTPFNGDVSNLVGTPEFIAPDLLVSTSCDGSAADMWSLGVMLYEALAGRTPFSGPNLPAIMRAALKNEYAPLPAEVGGECRDLVARLLQPDPQRRITMEQVLAHPWVRPSLEGGRMLSPLPSGEESGGGQSDEEDEGALLDGDPTLDAAGEAADGVPGLRPQASLRGCPSFGGRTCRSSPSSLDLSLVSQRSSLSLTLPGGEQETSGHLATVPEEQALKISPHGPVLRRGASGPVGVQSSAGGSGRSRQQQQQQQTSGRPKAAVRPSATLRPSKSLPTHAAASPQATQAAGIRRALGGRVTAA